MDAKLTIAYIVLSTLLLSACYHNFALDDLYRRYPGSKFELVSKEELIVQKYLIDLRDTIRLEERKTVVLRDLKKKDIVVFKFNKHHSRLRYYCDSNWVIKSIGLEDVY